MCVVINSLLMLLLLLNLHPVLCGNWSFSITYSINTCNSLIVTSGYNIFLSQQVLYFLLSTLVLTLYIDVVLSLSIIISESYWNSFNITEFYVQRVEINIYFGVAFYRWCFSHQETMVSYMSSKQWPQSDKNVSFNICIACSSWIRMKSIFLCKMNNFDFQS